MNVYISSSWKQRDRVRRVAETLRKTPESWIYDFTDPKCRSAQELPPERFPEPFDPGIHNYKEYLTTHPEWRRAVECNFNALQALGIMNGFVLLLLPCGLDAHADAYYGLGLGARLVIAGHPFKGERTPTHLMAEAMFERDEDAIEYIVKQEWAK